MTNGEISNEMKSRLIRANLPATYEELVALAAGVGIPADILLSEEGWLQLPTYLNKANLLDDVTEEAIWGSAADRTVNAALKMLADVAYGRVATLNLTVQDTTGAPIPDVTVKLNSSPVVGTDPRTDDDGKITISTNGGQHILYLIYPLGFKVETANQSVEISGVRDLTVNTAVRRANNYVYEINSAKTFYIARHLYPVQVDLRGGGGSGAAQSGVSKNASAQGGAGGYVTIDTLNTPGELIRAYIGAGAKGNGSSGGTTSLVAVSKTLTANGGGGGSKSSSSWSLGNNTNGGAYGGGGQNRPGGRGRYLFDDETQERRGGGGAGAYLSGSGNGLSGSGYDGGTSSYVYDGEGTPGSDSTPDATKAGGSGASCSSTSKINTGKGGPGFVAFRKAV